MSLLSIAEPGKSAAPHERKFAIGIDLGTTNSLVATRRNGTLELIPDEEGRKLCPSLVYYSSSNKVHIGYDALNQAQKDHNRPINSIKRLIGKKITEVSSIIETSTYDFSSSQNDLPLVVTNNGTKNPVEISAQILKHLKSQARSYLDNDITDAVITVPAYFDDTQRQATKDAAELAGLNVLRLLNEPTAAAIAYGINEHQEGTIVVYDLGGGTFDVSVLRIEKQVFKVLATGGNSSLGGDDFDNLLFNHLADLLELRSLLLAKQDQDSLTKLVQNSNIDNNLSSDSKEKFNTNKLSLLNQLKSEIHSLAVSVKKLLSNQDKVLLEDCSEFSNIINLSQQLGCNVKNGFCVSREEFDALIKPLVQKTLISCHQTLIDAKVSKDEITQVILVGGSTRVPAIQTAVANFFKREPLCSIDPDIVVALGAAMQADILIGNHSEDFLLIDVLPLSVGIEVYGGLVEKIIPRNTTIPIARAQDFSTAVDGQTGIKIHVVQGERDRAIDCRSLATFSLKGLPPRAAGALKIRVTYSVDADGLLSVSAKELTTGKTTEVQVQLSYGLTEDEVIKMLSDSTLYAQLDIALRKLYEELAESELLISSVVKQLDKYESLLTEVEESQINQNVRKLKSLCEKYSADKLNPELLNNDNAKTVREYANELNFWRSQLEVSTRDFAAKIMSSDISTYLRGKDIKDFTN